MSRIISFPKIPGTRECATITAESLLGILVWEEVGILHFEDGGSQEQEIKSLKAGQGKEQNSPIRLKKEHIAVIHSFEAC